MSRAKLQHRRRVRLWIGTLDAKDANMLAQIVREMSKSIFSKSRSTFEGFRFSCLFAHVAVLTSLPFLSGCFTTSAVNNAKTIRTTRFYDSANRIATAAITIDNRLYVCFECDSTNSIQKTTQVSPRDAGPPRTNWQISIRTNQFSVALPLTQIATNTQDFYSGYHRMRGDNSGMKKHVSFAILQVPVTAVQSGSTLPANSDIELKISS